MIINISHGITKRLGTRVIFANDYNLHSRVYNKPTQTNLTRLENVLKKYEYKFYQDLYLYSDGIIIQFRSKNRGG